ncbi:hypothetical protein [Serratia liquefaciens]|uniref:hypothetical protein n=1 Tax=Serratia liquefaciens TaxID=614 RepID=UPI0003585D6C|nr:hypothetical protein [Serratia liquefaciens]AGQ32471.1 hypothetical protein M495_19115 [Serratia liquefaciens ATCC 27592]CAI1003789.1 Uncharacterised protein [Serratia liquefaciens]CAI2028198.1 Uncharacterised protein [Serratia liquefaciens]CAI2400789.1 Uncharacterised protein [Serratia liquefaciens]
MKMLFNVKGKMVPRQSLKYKSKDDQLEVMRSWFLENYENPVHSCPYNGREGGYAYIYGGPFNAREELEMIFEGHVKDNYIEELSDELQDECHDWSGNSNNMDDWYDDDLYSAVTSSEEPMVKFEENIHIIRSLVSGIYKEDQKRHLLNILFTNVITALETLYVELFIKSLDKNQSYILDLIEKGKSEFKWSKDTLSLPFKSESIEQLRMELIKSIKENLISASWHNIDQVIKRYKAAFNIQTRNDWPTQEIEAATLLRNHLVHRGGKDKDGNSVNVTEQKLEELLDYATSLANKLYESLNNALPDVESEF